MVEAVEGLEDDADFGLYAVAAEHAGHVVGDVLVGEGGVDGFDAIDARLVGGAPLAAGSLVGFHDDVLHTADAEQIDGGAEGDELAEAGHVDAVIIWVTDLRRGGDDDDAARVEAVEDADDAAAEGGAAHDAVVYDDEVVYMGADASVGDVVDVRGEVVAAVALGDEGAELDVFQDDLLAPYALGEDAPHGLRVLR